MAHYAVLFNPSADNGHGEEHARKLTAQMPRDTFLFQSVLQITDYAAFLSNLAADTRLLICGGDGTLNRFINRTRGLHIVQDIYYAPCGSGNDFARDLGMLPDSLPICINPYLASLPAVTVKGETSLFINNVGYGIDGYCCEVGDQMRQANAKKINYGGIAIKGLLFHYHPTNATVTVDGVKHTYKKVWLAPTMNGRYYGGGMMPTPDQDRLGKAGTVSVMIFFGSDKIKTLTIFPQIFKGTHIIHTDCVEVLTGHDISVSFDRPTALQIDGETVLNVSEYHVRTAAAASGAQADVS